MLKAHEIVKLWEVAASKPNWEKAVLMLAANSPTETMHALAALSLGERNAKLFRLRESLFSTVLDANSSCPECAEGVEFQLNSEVICDPSVVHSSEKEFTLEAQESSFKFRLVNSFDLRDLLPVIEFEGAESAEYELIQRCLLSYEKDGLLQPAQSMTDEQISQVAIALKSHDPHAEIICRLSCPECSHSWPEPFDIVKFLWHEVETKAQIILSEVQLLAKAFGWWEGDILSLSDVRRKYYIESLIE